MAKKKIVLYGVAALFAVSGIVALPSGRIESAGERGGVFNYNMRHYALQLH